MQTTLGFIGIGLMGHPMVLRLLQAGYQVNVWNRTQEKLTPVVTAGATAQNSISDLVEASDIVMLCVSNTESVEAVVFGPGGIAQAPVKNKLLVDFSSIAPDATRTFAAKLAEQGMGWVDSPVSGGVAGAEAGTLAIMAGGEPEQIEAMQPVWKHLGQRVTHMGPVGSGQVTKIANQMIVSCNVLVMAEVLAMANKGGVDASKIPQALQGGFADSIPLQLTGSRMATGDFDEVKWHVKTLLKDLDMANSLAKDLGASIPMAGLGAEVMRMHGAQGNLENDPSTLINLYQDKSE